jgi:PAS domain S-box-containing protein
MFWEKFRLYKGTIVEENFKKAVNDNKSQQFEIQGIYTSDYYEVKVFPIKQGISVLFSVITNQKETEKAIEKKQQELNLILDCSPTIIFYKDIQGRFLLVNEAFAKALKVPKESLLGKTVFDIYPKEVAQAMTNDDMEVMQSRTPKIGIIEPYKLNNETRWIRTDKIPTVNSNGSIDGLIGFSEEITERKKAEDALQRNNTRVNEILESISDDFMVLDFNWNYVYANRQASKLVGLGPLEIVGKNYWELFPQNKGTEIESNLRQTMEKREIRRFEIHGQYSKRDKIITAYPSVEGIALIATDITQRKSLERQLHEKERLAAIGQTAGMVGHDLRNPLQTVVGELYIAESEVNSMPKSQLQACLKESLDSISEQVCYMDKIVSDLQTFVKPLDAIKQIVGIRELTISTLAQIDIPKNIQVRLDLTDEIKVETDPQLLKRVLINLITNSIQAMPLGGELTIQSYASENDSIHIVVKDTGGGIPEEIKSKIFTPLFTTKSKGQGFGLAVCKRVIEAQGGNITYESEVGKGTEFIIKFASSKRVPE